MREYTYCWTAVKPAASSSSSPRHRLPSRPDAPAAPARQHRAAIGTSGRPVRAAAPEPATPITAKLSVAKETH